MCSAACVSQPAAKKAPTKKAAAGGSKQATLSFAPSGRSTRTAASKAKSKLSEVVSIYYYYFFWSISNENNLFLIDGIERLTFASSRGILCTVYSSFLIICICYCATF
jgi:hypothetical protein